MKTNPLIVASFIGLTLSACNSTDNKPAIVVPVVAQTVRNLPADPTTGVDPTNGQPLGTTGKFTLFSFAGNKVIANSDSATSKWDVGFNGTRIIVNGGAIRVGKGGAYVHTGTFEELTTVPPSAAFAQDQSTAALAVPVRSGAGWYNYNAAANVTSPIPGRVLVVRTGDGKFAKIDILSYYQNAPATPDQTSQQRYYTFRYVYQPDGSTALN